MTLRAALGPLRSQFLFPTVRIALFEATRRDPTHFRLVHFSVQRDHVHLIVEATNARELSRGVRSVAIRIALGINRLLGRRGRFWAERWHGHELSSPREARNGLVYVLANFRKHSRRRLATGLDPYSSAAWFDGFAGFRPGSSPAPFAARPPPGVDVEPRGHEGATTHSASNHSAPRSEVKPSARPVDPLRGSPVLPPRTWLLRTGYRRHGLVSISEEPRARREASTDA